MQSNGARASISHLGWVGRNWAGNEGIWGCPGRQGEVGGGYRGEGEWGWIWGGYGLVGAAPASFCLNEVLSNAIFSAMLWRCSKHIWMHCEAQEETSGS